MIAGQVPLVYLWLIFIEVMVKICVVLIPELIVLRVEPHTPTHSLVEALPVYLVGAGDIIDCLFCEPGFLCLLANKFEFDLT